MKARDTEPASDAASRQHQDSSAGQPGRTESAERMFRRNFEPTPDRAAAPEAEGRSSLPDMGTVVAAVLSRKLLLIGVAILGIAAGLAIGMTLGETIWESEAVLLYKPANNQLTDEFEVLQNLDASTTFIYRQGSRKDQLATTTVQIKTLLNTVKIPANLEAVRAKLGLRVPLNVLGSAISARVEKETELMLVKARWTDAATAAALANGIVAAFIESNSRVNKENVVDMRDRLQASLDDVDARLSKVSAELAAFSERNRVLDLKNESEQYVQELIRLKAARDEAASRRDALKQQIANIDASIAELKASIAAANAKAGSRATSSEIEAKIAAINLKIDAGKAKKSAMAELMLREADLDRISKLYAEGLASKAELDRAQADKAKALAATQDDPETAALMAEIDALRSMQAAPAQSASPDEKMLEDLNMKRLEFQLEMVAAQGSVEAYDASSKRVQASVDAMPSVTAEYAKLSTEAAGLQAERKGIARMLDQALTALEKGASDFTIVAAAPTPAFPVDSNRKTLALGVAIAVVVLGWGALVLREILDSRIRSGAEAAAALKVDMLASLGREDRSRLMPGGAAAPAAVEGFRILALKVRRALPRRGVRILVASVLPGAGKSVVAANLAAALGLSDERVLVLDAETRKESRPWPLDALSAENGLSAAVRDAGPRRGLRDYLCFRADGLKEIARPTVLPGVDTIERGAEEAPPELLGSARFSDLLEEASRVYDVVLIEAPAVREFADASVIGARCDASLFVLRSRTATPAAAGRALDELGRDRILGAVLTDVDPAFAGRDA